jgi:hypothetical protein
MRIRWETAARSHFAIINHIESEVALDGRAGWSAVVSSM